MCPGPKLKTEDLLDRAALHIAKCPFARKTYAGLCRPVMRIVPEGVPRARLAGGFGYKHNADPAAPSWGVGLERRAHPDKSLQPLFLATRAGVGYLYY